MRRIIILILLLPLISYFSSLPATAQSSQNFVIDHTSVALFDQIPAQYIQAASNLKSVIQHASIGSGLTGALSSIQAGTGALVYQSFPANVYNRANFTFINRGNPGYSAKIDQFMDLVATNTSTYDIFMFKYCFIDYGNQQCYGCTTPFDRLVSGYNTAQNTLDTYNAQHNTHKRLIWWTLPLTRYESVASGDALNNQIRAYTQTNNLTLFDIADIESHDINGQLIVDAANRPVSWDGYCSESGTNPACHPTTPGCNGCTGCNYPPCDGGIVRIAKAWWVMMARLAGWQPTDGGVTPPPATITNTPSLPPDPVDYLDVLNLIRTFGQNLTNIFDFNVLVGQFSL